MHFVIFNNDTAALNDTHTKKTLYLLLFAKAVLLLSSVSTFIFQHRATNTIGVMSF